MVRIRDVQQKKININYMIGEIKVVEGNRKRFVEYCHYFISEIDKSIKEEGADKEGDRKSVV